MIIAVDGCERVLLLGTRFSRKAQWLSYALRFDCSLQARIIVTTLVEPRRRWFWQWLRRWRFKALTSSEEREIRWWTGSTELFASALQILTTNTGSLVFARGSNVNWFGWRRTMRSIRGLFVARTSVNESSLARWWMFVVSSHLSSLPHTLRLMMKIALKDTSSFRYLSQKEVKESHKRQGKTQSKLRWC